MLFRSFQILSNKNCPRFLKSSILIKKKTESLEYIFRVSWLVNQTRRFDDYFEVSFLTRAGLNANDIRKSWIYLKLIDENSLRLENDAVFNANLNLVNPFSWNYFEILSTLFIEKASLWFRENELESGLRLTVGWVILYKFGFLK